MNEKKYEIVNKGNSHFKLTVTPDRITIKVGNDAPLIGEERAIKFLDNVAKLGSVKDCTQSASITLKEAKDSHYLAIISILIWRLIINQNI
jgi:hypothetical protein